MTPAMAPDDDLEPDALPATIPLVVRRAAARFGDRDALVDGDLRWTFSSLADAVETAGRAFVATGLAPGDRVAIWAPNVAEWAIAALGVYAAGCVVVPHQHSVQGCGGGPRAAGVGCTDAPHRHRLPRHRLRRAARRRRTSSPRSSTSSCSAVAARRAPHRGTTSWRGRASRRHGRSKRASTRVERRRHVRHHLHVGHHRRAQGRDARPTSASMRAYTAWSDVVGMREGDRYLIVNPFFHAFGLKAGILACAAAAAPTILPHAVFDVPQVMRRVQEEQITMLPGPPAIYQTILNHPDLASSTCRHCAWRSPGAASIPVEMIVRMRKELPFETVVTGYGLTEATGIATMCRHDDDPDTIAKTVGRPIPGVEVRVVDDDRHKLAVGRAGRGRRAGLQRDEGLLRRRRRHRRGDRLRGLAAHRRRRACSTSAATSASPTA